MHNLYYNLSFLLSSKEPENIGYNTKISVKFYIVGDKLRRQYRIRSAFGAGSSPSTTLRLLANTHGHSPTKGN